MANDTFWNNPPWANGDGGYQMGLTPVALSHWCKQAITPTELETKLALLETNFQNVVQATSTSLPAQTLLADAVAKLHSQANVETQIDRLGDTANIKRSRPLLTAALTVPDDLCVLQRHNKHYELVAGCVTAPSYWRLPDKLGKTLFDVHNSVPGLNDTLGERMTAFFARLPAERCLQRRNWFLHGSDRRFQPQPERRSQMVNAAEAAKLTVRSETQTLRRLSDNVIVFTIAVSCYPLQEIAAFPTAANAMRNALKSRNKQERDAASQSSYETGVLAFLEGCH